MAGLTSLTSINFANADFSIVTNMSFMFAYCTSLTKLDLSSFDTRNVTNMTAMFNCCNNLTTIDLSSFNTSNVKFMVSMFFSCFKLKTIYVSSSVWITTQVTSSTDMFSGCTSLVGGSGTKYNSSYTNKTYARIDESLSPGYFTSK